jgi:iron complex transport system substrate-binding protein
MENRVQHNREAESIETAARENEERSQRLVLLQKMKEIKTLRIVSLAPSVTSILCAIGAKRTLVGVTKWCADLAPVEHLPKLGDCWYLGSVEEIVRLLPTMVIGSVPYKQETVAKLLEQPLNFLAMNPRSLADVYADIQLLGGIAGRAKEAERVIIKMKKSFHEIQGQARKRDRRLRIYCEAWPNPRISSPPWVAELIEICGGEMVLPAGEKISDEEVARANPEVMVLAWTATGMKADPKRSYGVKPWKDVAAIRERRVYVIRDELLNTPGPPLVNGARELRRVLQESGEKTKSLHSRC